MDPVIVVHGGAGSHAILSEDGISESDVMDGVKKSVRRGFKVLAEGGTALDAVMEAVADMEDNYIFNCGHGSCVTSEGTIEMDASIMDGRDFSTGGVICVQNVKNPIRLSRLIKEKSDHCLIVGDGAKAFAKNQGMTLVSMEELLTQKSLRRLEKTQAYQNQVKAEFDKQTVHLPDSEEHDTVGAVAVDAGGNVAYATSTGGITAKLPGRCGDSALPGCGGYANNEIGAVSTTGHGESFIKTCAANHAMVQIQAGKPIKEALDATMTYVRERVGGYGGIIGVTQSGQVGVSFDTPGMSWAYIKGNLLHSGLRQGQDLVESA